MTIEVVLNEVPIVVQYFHVLYEDHHDENTVLLHVLDLDFWYDVQLLGWAFVKFFTIVTLAPGPCLVSVGTQDRKPESRHLAENKVQQHSHSDLHEHFHMFFAPTILLM